MNKRRKDALDLINFISKSKNLDIEIIISFLLNSIQRIINSQLDPDAKLTLEIINNHLVLTNCNKLVIPDSEEYFADSKVVDIHLSEAQKINPDVKIGDYISAPISFDDFTRSTYSKIEHSFRIEIVNWERKRVYEKYELLIGQTVEAKLEEDFGDKGATFTLEDGTLCYMPSKYKNKAIDLSEKKYHNLTIEEVYENSKNFQVLVSNNSPNKVRELLKNEIPEIENGDIQIVSISRIKGERSKISFRKNPKYEGEIDVLGSVIGPNGSRINNVCELIGEKIDIILYSDNIIEYITNALNPAKVISVNKKPVGNGFLVVVPDVHNTLAIGKRGSNVKLTVELIRVNIDICSYTYAIENNIPIHWNGNITKDELPKLEENVNAINSSYARRNPSRNKNTRNSSGFFVDINEFEKEIAEYNSEISSYEPIDYSSFNYRNSENKKELEKENTEKENKNFMKNEINGFNENFKFDKDIAGDIDLNNYDFSDFDEEDF